MISVGKAVLKNHGIKIHNLRINQKPINMKLMNCVIPFNPNVYGEKNVSDDVKQTVSVTLNAKYYSHIQNLIDNIMDELEKEYPDIKNKFNSCLKPACDKYDALLRTQNFVEKCTYFDKDNTEISKPLNWRGLKCNVVINISGVYVSKHASGLVVRLTHLQFDPHEISKSNPFSSEEVEESDSIII